MFFAESFAQNVNWSLIAAAACGAGTLGMWWDARRARTVRMEAVQPPATLQELQDHARRLQVAELEIDKLWTTMRAEDKEIRKDVADKFDAISRALGRIEGELKTKHHP